MTKHFSALLAKNIFVCTFCNVSTVLANMMFFCIIDFLNAFLGVVFVAEAKPGLLCAIVFFLELKNQRCLFAKGDNFYLFSWFSP